MRQGEDLPQLLVGGVVAEVQQADELSHGRAVLSGPPPVPGATGQICSQTQHRESGQQGAGGVGAQRGAGPGPTWKQRPQHPQHGPRQPAARRQLPDGPAEAAGAGGG